MLLQRVHTEVSVPDFGVRPKHQQVADDLRARITSGELQPGEEVPTEQELVDSYGYSRDTVRKALAALMGEGLITNGQGRVRRVREHAPMEVHVTRTESRERTGQRATAGADAWVADVAELGRTAGQSIAVAIEEPSPGVMRRLGLTDGEMVVVRHHMRTIDGEPHNLSATYYSAKLAEGTPIMHPADIKEGVIALMARMGYVQTRFEVEFGARMPTPEEGQQLRIPAGVPVIVEHRTGFTKAGPVKVTVTVWPADRTRLICEFPG
jgi:GntR family transcriptional regulator